MHRHNTHTHTRTHKHPMPAFHSQSPLCSYFLGFGHFASLPFSPSAMAAACHYSHEEQQERADLLRQRLQWKSLNAWFRGNARAVRDRWHFHFREDPLTGAGFKHNSQESVVKTYPGPVRSSQIPTAPIDFTPAPPVTPPLLPPWHNSQESVVKTYPGPACSSQTPTAPIDFTPAPLVTPPPLPPWKKPRQDLPAAIP